MFSITCHFKNLHNLIISFHISDMKCFMVHDFTVNYFSCLVWLFAINRTTIPRIYSCSELVCAIVDLGIVGLSVMCAHCGHNLFSYLCKT